MYINSKKIEYTSVPVDLYNISNHMVYALDIYIVCQSATLLSEILTPDISLPVDGANSSLLIDGIEFKLKYGSPGESALNPITYIKNSNIAKYIIRDNINYNPEATSFVGSYLDGTWEQGTNIANNDSISLLFAQNYTYGKYKETTGYGNYKYGEEDSKIIGFGGVVLGKAETDLYIVVEESKVINKDLLYYYISLDPDAKSQISTGITYDAYN
jgi:hypothetical protein